MMDINDCLSSTENLCSTQHLGSKRALNLRQEGATYSIQTDKQQQKKGVLDTQGTHPVLWRCHKRSCLSGEGCTLVSRGLHTSQLWTGRSGWAEFLSTDQKEDCVYTKASFSLLHTLFTPLFQFSCRDLFSSQEGGSRAGMKMALPKDNLVG